MSRKRSVKLEFWVSPDEKEQIEQKMAELGTENLSAYLRKMAIDGRILKLDLPELREL
ncbi:MAG: plasmid mobilization protein, partial [Oscillospiraceae bacterium]